MEKTKEIELKKAIFTTNQIIIKKRKENIIIPLMKIDRILYAKPTFKNYLLLGFGDTKIVGALYIYLKEKINRKQMYCFHIKYNDVIRIPHDIFKKIKFFGIHEPWI
jgi:hypothetical protein